MQLSRTAQQGFMRSEVMHEGILQKKDRYTSNHITDASLMRLGHLAAVGLDTYRNMKVSQQSETPGASTRDSLAQDSAHEAEALYFFRNAHCWQGQALTAPSPPAWASILRYIATMLCLQFRVRGDGDQCDPDGGCCREVFMLLTGSRP